MKKNSFNLKKTSIVTAFTRQFLFTVLLPTVAVWMIYLGILNSYFTQETLAVQQTYLENSASQLELALSNAQNAFYAVEGNPEIIYYLDVYESKSDMLYALVKSIYGQSQELIYGNSSIDSLKLYSEKKNLLYSAPFYELDTIPLDPDEFGRLSSSAATTVTWHISPGSGDPAEYRMLPEIYLYKKLYALRFNDVVGYIEVKLSTEILQEFTRQFSDPAAFHGGIFGIYQNGQLLYSPGEQAPALSDAEIDMLKERSVYSNFWDNRYLLSADFQDTGLQLVISGRLSSLTSLPQNRPVVLITFFLAFLLFLFVRFFLNIRDLSHQILNFSSYLLEADTDNLSIYTAAEPAGKREYQELEHLISSYNNMIKENSTLISKVQKMELLSQDARYQSLQAQIHPHFIYGTLENIRMVALQNHDKAAADMTFALSALIRHSLSISSKAVSLADEIAVAGHYLMIQQQRFGERLSYEFRIEEALGDIRLPSFIMQPILENSILYGILDTLDPCRILISAYGDDTDVYLCIKNTGCIISQERLAEVNELLSGARDLSSFQGSTNGLALYNIKERLQIYFQDHAAIRMDHDAHWTITTITIKRSTSDV